jgi:hypothetical protein
MSAQEITPAVARAQQQINAMLGDDEPKFVPNHARSVLNAALDVEEIEAEMARHTRARIAADEFRCLCGYGLGTAVRLPERHARHQAEAQRDAILGGAS